MPEATAAQQSRRDEGPLTTRGVLRKQRLLAAARVVFERKGFNETRISDIAKEAKISHGTFYTYFDTKESIFMAVAQEVVDQMLHDVAVAHNSSTFHDRVRDAVRRYIDAYRPHATILGQMEQVGTFSPELRALRLDVRRAFIDRTERGIRRMQERGLADSGLDTHYTAEGLGAMLEYTCYMLFSLHHDLDENRLVAALGDIWERALLPLAEPSA